MVRFLEFHFQLLQTLRNENDKLVRENQRLQEHLLNVEEEHESQILGYEDEIDQLKER